MKEIFKCLAINKIGEIYSLYNPMNYLKIINLEDKSLTKELNRLRKLDFELSNEVDNLKCLVFNENYEGIENSCKTISDILDKFRSILKNLHKKNNQNIEIRNASFALTSWRME